MTPLLLAPFELVYASIVRARNARFNQTAPERLQWPVISVGNLSVGGAGKTPLVICLARLLQRAGFQPDVLSRGYKRSSQLVDRVALQGTAEQFGDEPLLIAQMTGVPVFVGSSRYEAGRLAEREATAGGRYIHLLDDGFQHRQLSRDLDIVVVHRSDLQQRLLPAGRLREPLSSLARAGVLVLRHEDAHLESAFRAHVGAECRFWRVRRSLAVNPSIKRGLAFCAIARPDEFFSALVAHEVGLAGRKRFPDHHRYTATDIDRLAALGSRLGCDAFIITAKDEVKVDLAMRLRLQAVAPLETAELVLAMDDEDQVMEQLTSVARVEVDP